MNIVRGKHDQYIYPLLKAAIVLIILIRYCNIIEAENDN